MTSNLSGINPQGDRVLVQVEEIEETTDGGIIIPKTQLAKHEMAQMAAVLVATGNDAWSDYLSPFAQIGERVLYQRHSGIQLRGKDGRLYRLVNDVDIIATLEDGVEFHDFHFSEARQPLGEAAA
jgi:co-chaperonin GroES (HSP10)